MFDKEKFSNILIEINKNYDNMTEFAKVADFDRTYISKYIHKKLDNPPTPKILMGIANASKGKFNYYELMQICGYINLTNTYMQPIDKKINCIPLLYKFDFSKDNYYNEDFIIDYIPFDLKTGKIENYFAYESNTDDMLPLLGIGDIAIIEKTDTFQHGQTCLFAIDNKDIMIRKIMVFQNYIELHTAFPYSPPIKLTKDEMKERNFTILGRVIKVENQSAFK